MTVTVRIDLVEDGIDEAIVILQGKEDKYPHFQIDQEFEVIGERKIGDMRYSDLKHGRQRLSLRFWEGAPNTMWDDLIMGKTIDRLINPRGEPSTIARKEA